MGYERNDRGYGRYAGRNDAYRADSYRNAPYGAEPRYGRDDPSDRGFFDRAGDEVRSWFGDEEAERRRRLDERYDERADRERGDDRYGRYASGGYGRSDYPRYDRSNQAGGSRGYAGGGGYGGYPAAGWGSASGEGRIYGQDSDYGFGADAGYRGGQGRNWRDDEYRALYEGNRGASRDRYDRQDDPHGYRGWRSQQIDSFDRDYDEYRRENQSRFASEFSAWRETRQGQRNSLRQAREHQEVVGSDGAHVGKVDHIRGDRILLTKTDKDAGGHHHSIPSSWIQSVDDKVHLAKTADEAHQAWRDEEANRGLFGNDERDRLDDRGATNLNRSFSGTY